MRSIEDWLGCAGHLPDVLKDFHDQKAVFRAMHDLVDMSGNDYALRVDPITGHAYVVDAFLQFMARRGYTLQRSRQQLPFRDLELDVERANLARGTQMSAAMASSPADDQAESKPLSKEDSESRAPNPTIVVTLFSQPSDGVRGDVVAFIPIGGHQKRIAHATLFMGKGPSVTIDLSKLPFGSVDLANDAIKAFTEKVCELSPEAQ